MVKNTSKVSGKSGEKTDSLTMADLLAQHGGSFSKKLERGDEVEGTILEITSSTVTLEIGRKAEGLVAESAYQESRDFIKKLKVGDKVKAKIIVAETPEGYAILSFRDASHNFIWDRLQEILDKDDEISVSIKNVTGSGLLVDIMGVNGFIPNSYLSKKVKKNTEKLVGTNIKVKLIEIDKDTNKVILSEKHVTEKEEIQAEKDAIEKLVIGENYQGIITTVTDFGIFVAIKVDLGKGKLTEVEGLVHVSELSWDKVGKPSDIYSTGDKVKVRVVSKDHKKIVLSIKKTQKDPWDEIGDKYKVDQKIKGKVMKISDFGIFVQLEPGVEGLIHITKVPPGKRFELGQEVEVYIEDIDNKEKKISLGIVLTAKPLGYK